MLNTLLGINMNREETYLSIQEQHNVSYFLSAIRTTLRGMRGTYKRIPIDQILSNFTNVESYFNKKKYLTPQKFWGYSIGRCENGKETKHENTLPTEGIYLTVFRTHRGKLLFEYYRIRPDGTIEENVISKMTLDYNSIDGTLINRASTASSKYLKLRTSRFSSNLTLQPFNPNYSEYYKFRIDSIINETRLKSESVEVKIDSAYIKKKIEGINKSKESDQIIGDSKDLIESICKTILKKHDIEIDKDWPIARLIKECNKLIVFDIDELENKEKIEKSLKQILQGVGTTVQAIAEIRNQLGTGHGRDSEFVKIKNIYDHFISANAFQISQFYIEHFKGSLE